MKTKLFAIQVLSALAFINASYLSYKAYYLRFVDPLGLSSFCDISKLFSCTDVLRHPLSQVFGLSFPWIAMVVYPVIFAVAFLGSRHFKRVYVQALAGVSFLGILFNGFIIYREFFFIHAFCILCLLCTLIIVSIFGLSLSMARRK